MHRRGAECRQHFACFRRVGDEAVALDMGVSFFHEPFGCIPGTIGAQASNPLDPAGPANILHPECDEVPARPQLNMEKAAAALGAWLGASNFGAGYGFF